MAGLRRAVGRVLVRLHAQLALHRPDLAERPVGDQLAKPDDRGLEPGPHRLHGEPARGPGEVDDLARRLRRHRERLLQQDRLPRPQRSERDRTVLRMGGGDVEDVDAVVVEHGLVGVVHAGDPVRVGERLRPLGRARRHGHELRPGHVRRIADHLRRDPARPDDTPANGHGPILVDQPADQPIAQAQASHTVCPCRADKVVITRSTGERILLSTIHEPAQKACAQYAPARPSGAPSASR